MKINTIYFFLSSFILLSACSTTQKVEKNVSEGNYDAAMDIAYAELKNDKNNDDLVKSFKEAYNQANAQDLAQIDLLKKQPTSPENLKKIYALYEKLDARQYQVLTLKPLYYKEKEVAFDIVDYTHEINTSKQAYTNYLYQTGQQKLATGNKLNAREALKLFEDLQYVNPTYVSNLDNLIERAKLLGSSLVYIKVNNNIQQYTTPADINELTRISEANMTNPWIVFDDQRDYAKSYDYQVDVNLNNVQISAPQTNKEVVPQQKQIVDGWEYVYDSNGNVMKDKDGNNVKRQKVITVQAEIRLVQQLKEGVVNGTTLIKNLKTNATGTQVAIQGEAKFENIYGQYRGDQRAIDEKYYKVLQNKEVPFPHDSLFVQYGLKDFKSKLLQYIDQQGFSD